MVLEEAYRVAITSMQQELERITPHIKDYEQGIYNTETRYALKRRGELSTAISQFTVQIEKAIMEKRAHQ